MATTDRHSHLGIALMNVMDREHQRRTHQRHVHGLYASLLEKVTSVVVPKLDQMGVVRLCSGTGLT